MIAIYEEYRIFISLVFSSFALALTLYCLIKSTKQDGRYQYYWKGFLLLSLGGIFSLLGMVIPLSGVIGLMRRVFALAFGIAGFYFVILGGKIGQSIVKRDSNK